MPVVSWETHHFLGSILQKRRTQNTDAFQAPALLLGSDWIFTRYHRFNSWWRHQMETFSALLTICAGNSPVTGELLAQRPVTRSFDVFFDVRLNKQLSKQWWGWWFETPSRPLWRQCNVGIKSRGQSIHPINKYWRVVRRIPSICLWRISHDFINNPFIMKYLIEINDIMIKCPVLVLLFIVQTTVIWLKILRRIKFQIKWDYAQ